MAFTEEMGSGRATVNKDSKAFHLALARRKEVSFFFLLGSAALAGHESFPLLSPDSI